MAAINNCIILQISIIMQQGGYHPTANSAQSYCRATCRVRRLDAPLPRQRHDVNLQDLYPTFSPYHNQTICTTRVSAFSFCLKKKMPAKEKQTRGFTPRPRQRRAAAHSLQLSVGNSAYSPVNSLRSNNTGSCVLLRKPFSPLKTQSPIALGAGAMLLVFRQHRLASSATGGASVMLPAFPRQTSNTTARLLKV